MKNKVLVLLVISFLFVTRSKHIHAQEKPNILLITIDDLNDWVGCLDGHKGVKTPHMDALASQGVCFTNAHVQAPICNPSRTSFMTGLRPTTTGIYALGPWFRTVDGYEEHVTLPQYFEQHGYHTLATGKVYHDAYPPKQERRDGPEFTTWGFKGGFFPRPEEPFVPESGHPLVDWGVFPEKDELQDDWKVAEWAIEHLKKPPKDKPFFLSVGFRHPHVPLFATQQWFDLYPEEDIVLPQVLANDREDIPDYAWYLHWKLPEPRLAWLEMEHQWKPKVRAYLASISFADYLVGRVLKTLKDEGLSENTIVVLLSDHGYHMGEKNITGKNTLWNESTRVPFIFAGPGIPEKGKKSFEAVELLDMYPTLIDLAGLPQKSGLEGTSLKPILQDVTTQKETPALCCHGPGNHAVITEQWRYIRYADGSQELYNIIEDPEEWNNLADIEGFQPVIEYLDNYIPKQVADPAPGNTVRLNEIIDSDIYWQGKKIEPGSPVPMSFK